MMRFFERLFPSKEVRAALASIEALDRSLPNDCLPGTLMPPAFGFRAIRNKLRRQILHNSDELRKAQEKTGHSIDVLTIIIARNIAWEELWFYRPSMTGDGLIGLYHHLTNLLEQVGAATKTEAEAARASLREMMRERHRVG